MYEMRTLTTSRLTTAYYRAGEGNENKLILVHGNVSSAVFYLPLFPKLEKHFDVIALDLRCFGDSTPLPIDATRGFRDWTDDIYEFVTAIGWDKFTMTGWSMGGCIAMEYIMEHGEMLTGVVLINPGSPYGFGGTKGIDGVMLEPAGLASGGGCANVQLVQALLSGDRELPRVTLNNVYFKPPFRMEAEWEERFIDSILKTRIGDGMYPGDTRQVEQWPGIASGDKGVCNTMAPNHCDLYKIVDVPVKPPILWVRGDSDVFVSDTSTGDFGFLGQMGVVGGWPGGEVFPPQPMLSQTRYVLDQYKGNGGAYTEMVIPGAHGCQLESPEQFVAGILEFLSGERK